MLSAAGIPIEIIAAAIDERAIERTIGADRDPDELALLLSWEKANAVSHEGRIATCGRRRPDACARRHGFHQAGKSR